jgi:hypothetical protein
MLGPAWQRKVSRLSDVKDKSHIFQYISREVARKAVVALKISPDAQLGSTLVTVFCRNVFDKRKRAHATVTPSYGHVSPISGICFVVKIVQDAHNCHDSATNEDCRYDANYSTWVRQRLCNIFLHLFCVI